MNIFNLAQDRHIKWINNIDWWILKNMKPLYRIIHKDNSLNEKRAKNICKILFNQICINEMGRLVRVIGFGDDEEDFYYITKDVRGMVVWETMVGHMIPIKGRISNWEYWKIERGFAGWAGNGGCCPEEKEFLTIFETRSELK